MFKDFKSSMMIEFEMSDLGLMHYFLGIEVMQTINGIFISQKKYVCRTPRLERAASRRPSPRAGEFNVEGSNLYFHEKGVAT